MKAIPEQPEWDALGVPARAATWSALPTAAQQRLTRETPERVAHVDGLPVDVRDEANRRILAQRSDQILTETAKALEEIGPGARIDKAAELSALRHVLDSPVESRDGSACWGLRPQLLEFDDQKHHVVVGLGDLVHADLTIVFLPGMGTTVNDVGTWLERVRDTIDEIHRHDPSVAAAGVYWQGYDPPHGPLAAASAGRAIAAAEPLAEFVEGLRFHMRPDARLDIEAHSYGCRVFGEALTHHHLAAHADRFIINANPGLGIPDPAQLGVDPGRMAACTVPGDVIELTGLLRYLDYTPGPDPRYQLDDSGVLHPTERWFGPDPGSSGWIQSLPTGTHPGQDSEQLHSACFEAGSLELTSRALFHLEREAEAFSSNLVELFPIVPGPSIPDLTTRDFEDRALHHEFFEPYSRNPFTYHPPEPSWPAPAPPVTDVPHPPEPQWCPAAPSAQHTQV
ncbi:alpha/beta hydrolase, partial [Frankia sp. CiP3]|uniref:alpha/beta hydrolase n=1 Tax=Frankia sp. CiP3 TaxID=2880971 RepID=UPI001EF4A44B